MSDIEFSSTESIASYGIGIQMGQQLKAAFADVSLAAALAGVKDAFNGDEQQLSNDQINEAFQVIQRQIEAEKAGDALLASKEGEAFLAENAKRQEVTVTDSGLQYEVLTEGDGDIPTTSAKVRTHYRGTLIDGTQFDSSYDRGQPAEFPVTGVIAGWTEALQKMKVGSKWKLYIPYQLAYGERGAGGAIGPYQALIFDIELLAIV